MAPVRTAPKARTRLGGEDRRRHLVEVGVELFNSKPFDAVSIDEVAERAGIAKGLLYHYFPSKRAFYVAVIRETLERIGELTAPDPALPPLERLQSGVDAYLDYAERNAAGYRFFHRSGIGFDPEVRSLYEGEQARQARRLLQEIHGPAEAPDLLRLAVHGWLGFLVETVLNWLDNKAVPRDELRDLLAHALIHSVTAAVEIDPRIQPAGPNPLDN